MENIEKIKQYLELVFDKVEIQYYEPQLTTQFIFEQNGKTIRRNYFKATHGDLFAKPQKETDIKIFCKGLALDVMDQFIEEGIISTN